MQDSKIRIYKPSQSSSIQLGSKSCHYYFLSSNIATPQCSVCIAFGTSSNLGVPQPANVWCVCCPLDFASAPGCIIHFTWGMSNANAFTDISPAPHWMPEAAKLIFTCKTSGFSLRDIHLHAVSLPLPCTANRRLACQIEPRTQRTLQLFRTSPSTLRTQCPTGPLCCRPTVYEMSAQADAAAAISGIAAAGNVILFSSPIPLMLAIIREGDSTKYDWLPYLTMLLTMSLWCGYTVWVLPTVQVYVANFSGMILPIIYLTIFTIYAKSWVARAKIFSAMLLALAVTWGFSAGVYANGGVENATLIQGGITAAVNVSFFLSPLRQLYRAAVETDLSRVPMLLSLVQFFQPVPWVIAGALLNDWFLTGVNSTGWAFGILQMGVILYVRHKREQLDGVAAASKGAAAEEIAVENGVTKLLDAANSDVETPTPRTDEAGTETAPASTAVDVVVSGSNPMHS